MALSINAPIVNVEIGMAKALSKGHPVFLLEGWNTPMDSVVIKAEADANLGANRDQSVRFNAKVISAVDKKAKQKVLTAHEVQQVNHWADFILRAGPPVDLSGVRAMKVYLDTPQTWIKMEPRKLSTMGDAIKSRLAGDKADVRMIAKALSRKGGLEKLGSIAAADLFNGSNDRFDAGGGANKADYGITGGGNFNHLRNVGNIFITCDEKNLATPIGLDSYDYTSTFRNMNQSVADLSDELAPYFGVILGDNQHGNRKQFSVNCIEDLEAVLGPRNRKLAFATQRRLPSNAAKRFEKGMVAGAKLIKTKFANKPNLPVGMSSRKTALGW
jgi:hypothetical protein